MKISKLILENFRIFKERTYIDFDDLTVLIGKNDYGKSSILEALEIFFNNDLVKIEKQDLNVKSEHSNILIGVTFKDLPEKLTIDADVDTTLKNEFLLNKDKEIEIHKIFTIKSRVNEEIYIYANHPSNENLNDLLTLKISELRKRANELGIDSSTYDARISSQIRQAIWQKYKDNLQFTEQRIPINEADGKKIWEQLKKYLPTFALFQSDRKNLDQDGEIQDPLKTAVKDVLKQVEDDLKKIEIEVITKVQEVADLTIHKLKEMNPEIANTLTPTFSKTPKWESAFNFSMTSDDQIPLNKRGSGVRRLVLLNFFRAEAERKRNEKNSPNIIYALEEPETSQHPDYQKKLMEAFIELSNIPNTQCILTTHSPGIANLIPVDNLRLLEKVDNKISIEKGGDEIYKKIAERLGVLPDIRDEVEKLKVVVCVEGPTDVNYLINISSKLEDNCKVDLINDKRVIIIPLGGNTLKQWVNMHYLKKLKKPEIHIYDSDNVDNPKYKSQVDEINSRNDGSKAFSTKKKEIENYVHPSIIEKIFSITNNNLIDRTEDWLPKWNELDVIKEIQRIKPQKENLIKEKITKEGSSQMTLELLKELQAYDEIKEWFQSIINFF